MPQLRSENLRGLDRVCATLTMPRQIRDERSSTKIRLFKKDGTRRVYLCALILKMASIKKWCPPLVDTGSQWGRLPLIARLLSPRQPSHRLSIPIEYQVQDASKMRRCGWLGRREWGGGGWRVHVLEPGSLGGVMCAGGLSDVAPCRVTSVHIIQPCELHATYSQPPTRLRPASCENQQLVALDITLKCHD